MIVVSSGAADLAVDARGAGAPQARCGHLAEAMRKARRYDMIGVAHLPSLELPDEFDHLLATFLRRLAQ